MALEEYQVILNDFRPATDEEKESKQYIVCKTTAKQKNSY